ncbi:MAG TPA: glycosyltransferase family 2 protein, partial [Thiotrichaceae bacterium]|nr:glycosyltransferase family 2 protein [Thiotrichaceae bacterium]
MPIVTVVIPVLNEEQFVKPCLDSLISQDIGRDNLEILVVDGGSTDRTKEIVKKLQQRYNNIKLLDNPKKYTVFAFNIGIINAHPDSEYITFLNCHATYSKDRLRKSIEYAKRFGADAVGGRSEALPRNDTLLGRAISLMLRSRFGTGSRFRSNNEKIRFVDTASGCLYRTTIFRNVGLFNENLFFSQDIEFNKRLFKTGGKILFVPELKTIYKVRSDINSFIKHTFRNGVWAILPFKYSKNSPVSLRHVTPGISLVIFILTLALSFIGLVPLWIPGIFFSLYILSILWVTLKIALENEELILIPWLVMIFCLFHNVYAIGSIVGFIKCLGSSAFRVD